MTVVYSVVRGCSSDTVEKIAPKGCKTVKDGLEEHCVCTTDRCNSASRGSVGDIVVVVVVVMATAAAVLGPSASLSQVLG